MKPIKLLVLLLLLTELTYSQNSDDIIIAKKIRINSEVLGEERTIFVSTPSNYSDSNKFFPVMYVLDGYPALINFTSGLTGNLSAYDLCPEMIIVAIENTNRLRDLTPTKPRYNKDGKEIKYESWDKLGEADKFLTFIETELFPYIDKNYRTISYRIFSGHSAGGICVTHAFLSHNNMFNSYIAISPSLYWDSGLLNRTAEEKIDKMNLKNKQYYFSIGGKELPSYIEYAHTFAKTLNIKAPKDLRWKFDFIENEDHGSQVTVALYNGLRFIYDGWKYDYEEMVAGGFNIISGFYKNLSEKYGYEIIPEGSTLNSIGWGVLRTGRHEEAIKIFEDNIRLHPDFPEGYTYLASGYQATGNYELTIQNFEKAVELATTLKDSSLERYKLLLENAKAGKK